MTRWIVIALTAIALLAGRSPRTRDTAARETAAHAAPDKRAVVVAPDARSALRRFSDASSPFTLAAAPLTGPRRAARATSLASIARDLTAGRPPAPVSRGPPHA